MTTRFQQGLENRDRQRAVEASVSLARAEWAKVRAIREQTEEMRKLRIALDAGPQPPETT